MTEQQTATATDRKLSVVEQVVCALPIGLVAVGGLVGGAFGGLAWFFNQKIMRSARPASIRYLLVALTIAGAVGAYFASIVALALLFPNLFATT